MRVRVLYHDHCFDGAASAALFTRFLEEKFHPGADFDYTGLAHKASQLFEPEMFDGEVNAIVDFKYSPDPKLTWWFDHHQSAFLVPEDEAHFRHDTSGKKFFDPTYRSCTQFIADITREHWQFVAPDLKELIHWADVIDGALYPNAKTAVELAYPAVKLMMVIEGARGSEMVQTIIRRMTRQKLDEIIEDPEIQAVFRPLYHAHLDSIDEIRKRAKLIGPVLYFDLTDHEMEGYNKFIPYYLFPESVYTVSLLTSSYRTKISVGSNPWAPEEPEHNLATICEHYGGGGHPRVGAISLERGEVEKAREIAAEVVETLRTKPAKPE